ncbi:hypothetical protein [Streptomyces sp. NPDC058412]|uniref:hypothetical protein n=1 Tax=Streptomyces sp. NPDC058412 TaxID=3346486 RepID=UPI0036682CCA
MPRTGGSGVNPIARDAKAARGEKAVPAEVHELTTGKKTAKKAAKRTPAKSVPTGKKAVTKRKPRSA